MLASVTQLIDHAGEWALTRLADADRVFPALVARDRVLDLSSVAALGAPSGTGQLLDRWDDVLPVLDRLARSTDGWRPLAGLRVLPPVEPRQVFQTGANYRTHVIDIAVAHADESDGRTVEQVRADAAAEMDTRLQHRPTSSRDCRARSAARTTTSSSRSTGSSRTGNSSSPRSSAAAPVGCRPSRPWTSSPAGRSSTT